MKSGKAHGYGGRISGPPGSCGVALSFACGLLYKMTNQGVVD